MTKIISVILILFVISMILINVIYRPESESVSPFPKLSDDINVETKLTAKGKTLGFLHDGGLLTNTSITSVDIDKVLTGCQIKDCIPSIDEPHFISTTEASEVEKDPELGVSVSVNGIDRFYPYTIMVWHEIVNDSFGDVPVLITFCPLCGSSIVYNPVINGEREYFGVSGKLFESNLLMYDYANESLWSQARAEVVVGDRIGEKLEIIDSDIMTFGEFKKQFPDGDVLSRDTGQVRQYGFYPYGDYDDNDQKFFFPISIQDTLLSSKTLMYVVPTENASYAFNREDLLQSKSAKLINGESTVSVMVDDSKLIAIDQDGNGLSGYIEMWFSWAQHHQDDGHVWIK